ncbi:Aste57867_11417 [Aphanomyces stellatus]|uniref:Aste57867_11417 protein n=1 Tax=Aphanomyces stellatus TaxID=120398 RepID=A0A485KSX6_9STRA|nr:hypothetical protein As57867_011375 [Aphanomyces stellatus]VFT88278.1 Aste57867_11417 [Aphanomyces stellatus]
MSGRRIIFVAAAVWSAAVVTNVSGYYDFTRLIPNGRDVPDDTACGHSTRGLLNQFGNDFEATNYKWTPALCEKDSDGDGATNGQELGDPCCVWEVGKTPDAKAVSSPGKPNKFSTADLEQLKCKGQPEPTLPTNQCDCTVGHCVEGLCSGCNRVDAAKGNYCLTGFSQNECAVWGEPYIWCGMKSQDA